MSIVKQTVNSIFREYADEYLRKYKVSDYAKKIIRAIIDCRTEKLGGHIQKCDHCGDEITLYNSCRNKHCPQCQFMKKEEWKQARQDEVLPYQYFHVVFTLPDSLNPIVFRNKRTVYKLLFDKVKETLLTVAEDEEYFGAKIGFFSILHTWGQKLNLHPHIHCVVPGGGYSLKNEKWISCPNDFMLPVKVLSQRFRSLFLVGLKDLYKSKKLYLGESIYNEETIFQNLINKLFATEWIVYIKESFKNSNGVIEYLSNYTHRIAISNHRIIDVKDRVVSFYYRDYKNDNKKEIMKMDVLDFINRFLLHIVPYRFTRIRYYGILSLSTKKKTVDKCREYYKVKIIKLSKKSWDIIFLEKTGIDIHVCQKCKKGKMEAISIIKTKRMCCAP